MSNFQGTFLVRIPSKGNFTLSVRGESKVTTFVSFYCWNHLMSKRNVSIKYVNKNWNFVVNGQDFNSLELLALHFKLTQPCPRYSHFYHYE